jgi:hypothetical protein
MSGISETLSRAKHYYREGQLFSAIYRVKIKPILYGISNIHDPSSSKISIHCPEYVKPSQDPEELEIVQRIFNAYKKMKADQPKNNLELFAPSSLWQGQLDQSYANLNNGLANNDLETFHFFLSNFGTWKSYTGIENNIFIRENSSFLRKRYLRNTVIVRSLKHWQWITNGQHHLSRLHYPTHGNQSGFYMDDLFAGIGSFSGDFYGSMLSELLKGKHRPVVAELGAGYGKFSYFILRDIEQSSFIDFDLPEVLSVASYYLMKSWPNKKTLLYGERPFSSELIKEYDLTFMPSFLIDRLEEGSVDLFVNKNSLGEMRRATANHFVSRISKVSKYFFHMNHESFSNTFENDERSLLCHEYPIPDDRFKLLVRYPELMHMTGHGGFDKTIDIFYYLYESLDR